MRNDPHLKPCLKCRGPVEMKKPSDVPQFQFQIECSACYLIMPGDNPDDLAYDWNNRKP